MVDKSRPQIEAVGLCKYYGDFAAIDNVNFSVAAGEIVAFLGPNGAGKSTTMRILTGYLAASAGEARLGGYDIATNRLAAAKLLGYLPETGPLYPDMTPRSLLRFVGNIRKMPRDFLERRIEHVTELCSLDAVVGKPIRKLSKGYRQRVGMAQALLHDPAILILDEPTAGLDPNQIHDVRETIRKLGKHKTILLSTHIMQEVEAMASRIIFISEGKLVFDGAVEELSKKQESLDGQFRRLSGTQTPA